MMASRKNPIGKITRNLLLGAGVSLLAFTSISSAQEATKFLYTQSNHVDEGQNSILGYQRGEDGALTPLAGNPFLTSGTGMNNNTFGKVGPHDNDTPIALSDDGKFLFTVNAHSNTVAVFHVMKGGDLKPVTGSPFSSMGIMPNSVSVSGDVLLVSNRNGDYHQKEELMGKAKANYVSFKIQNDGSLKFVSKIDVDGFQKPTQILTSSVDPSIAFGNDFQVDVDFDKEGDHSFLAGPEDRVQGQIHSFKIADDGKLSTVERVTLPETDPGHLYKGSPGVPTVPLGIWDHPKERILYVGFITRNELGVYTYDENGKMSYVRTVPNSGQDICWVLVNKEGTRVYTINNLPRDEQKDTSATISVYDIEGDKALAPEEIGRVLLPKPGTSFVNNRMFDQPGSTPFQVTIDPDGKFLYVVNQRINQTAENKDSTGNFIHTFAIDDKGLLSHVSSRSLEGDGVNPNSRPQGVVALNQ